MFVVVFSVAIIVITQRLQRIQVHISSHTQLSPHQNTNECLHTYPHTCAFMLARILITKTWWNKSKSELILKIAIKIIVAGKKVDAEIRWRETENYCVWSKRCTYARATLNVHATYIYIQRFNNTQHMRRQLLRTAQGAAQCEHTKAHKGSQIYTREGAERSSSRVE